ncbi:MAG: antitoxin Xre/MbcA/ParS toxin-binding domain-containing protein [Pedobacter sp.]
MSYHAVAEVLGIEEPQSNVDLIDIVRHGLPSEGVTALSYKLGITPGELSRYLHVSLKTLQRYKGKVLDINMSDRLLTVALVYSKCVDVFGSEENSVSWLKSPVYALGNARPLDYLDTNAGAEMIMTLLGRIEYGVYS